MANLSHASAQALARLRTFMPSTSVYSNLPLSRRAAVLLLLYADQKGGLRAVLTIRASTLSSYAGQAAFPGGKADFLAESPWQTARREAEEEISLPANDKKIPYPFEVRHLCQLPVYLAKTKIGVAPCVAFLNGSNVEERLIPRLDGREVAAVFSAPFHNFLMRTDEIPLEKHGKLPSQTTDWYQGVWVTYDGIHRRLHSFYVPVEGQTVIRSKAVQSLEPKESSKRLRVFGLTARILLDAARIAYNQTPEMPYEPQFGDEDLINQLLKEKRLKDRTKNSTPKL